MYLYSDDGELELTVHCDVLVFPAVPWHRADGGRRCHWLFLVLPGGKEFTHYGVIQEPRTSGLKLLN